MRYIYKISLLVLTILGVLVAQGQNIDDLDGTTQTGCSFTIYDSGGSTGDYGVSKDYSVNNQDGIRVRQLVFRVCSLRQMMMFPGKSLNDRKPPFIRKISKSKKPC